MRRCAYETGSHTFLMKPGKFSLNALLRSSTLSIVASAFSYATLMMLARILDQDAFTHYLYVLVWGMIAVQVIDCAADQCLLHFSRVSSREPQELWVRLIGLKLIVLVVFVASSLILGTLTNLRFPVESLLLILPAFYLGPVYESQQRNVKYAAVNFAERVAIFVSAVVIAWAGWQVEEIFLAYFFVSAASLVYQLRGQFIQQVDFKPAGHWRPYLASYAPVYFVLISQLFYGNISRLIIESKLGVLVFGAVTLALQIINLMSLVQTQVDKQLRPNLIHAAMHRDVNVIALYARNYSVYYLVPLAIAALCLSLSAGPLMGLLFGERWAAAGHPLSILSPLLVTVACLRFLDILVVTMNLGKINLVANIAAAAMLSLLLILMPAGYDLKSYLVVIVLVQMLHVMSMSWVVFSKLKKIRT